MRHCRTSCRGLRVYAQARFGSRLPMTHSGRRGGLHMMREIDGRASTISRPSHRP